MKMTPACAALLIAQIGHAATPIDGLYATVFGGYAYLPSNINNITNGIWRTDASYQSGFDAGGSFGYKSNPMRYEGEITYLTAALKDFRANQILQTYPSGYSNAVAAMMNAYYDFPPLVPCIEPYLGAGLGYAWVKAKLDSQGPFGQTQFSESNAVFAYQATAGLTYNFAENYALTLGYRYLATQQADSLGRSFQAHLANIGVVYRFNEFFYK